MKFRTLAAGLLLSTTLLSAPYANALTLKEAIATAMVSNPEIGQARENREATEFELRQARGLYLPTLDLEASTGVRSLDTSSRRLAGTDSDALHPSEVGLTLTQKLFDGGGRRAELDMQAARVDSASFRVLDRSESIALQIVRDYFEYLLQLQILEESRKNVDFHQAMANDIGSLISSGTLTEADRQQARERLLAAKARMKEAQETLESVKASFNRLVGQPLLKASMPPSMAKALPGNLQQAIDLGRRNNPRIKVANADIDAADAQVRGARNNYLPEVSAEGRVRTGWEIDGSEERTTDAQVRLVARWNLYRGGIDVANEQEQIRRAGEQREALRQAHGEVEESVRTAWDRRIKQAELAGMLREQASANAELVSTYREQLSIGQRSLLDVLGAQNTRYNVNVLAKTAEFASRFAEYRVLAATGSLLKTLNIKSPKQSDAYARNEFNTPTGQSNAYRRQVSQQTNGLPMDLFEPVNQ